MGVANYGLLFIIIGSFISGIIVLINPFGFFSVNEYVPIILIGIAVFLSILLMVSSRSPEAKANLQKADSAARKFIFINYQYFDMPLINHDLIKDDRGRLVFMLEYKLQSGMVLNIYIDIATTEITRHQKLLARTPLRDPKSKREQQPIDDRRRKR